MSKTAVWVLVGLLVAAVSAVAVVELRPRGSADVVAANDGSKDLATSATVVPTAIATPPAVAEPAAAASAPAAAVPVAEIPAVVSSTPTVDDLIQNAAAYGGKAVALKGTIITQCTAGCEFALDDGTGVISVQLEGKGKDRLIPLGKVGKTIQILGTFRSSPRPQIVIEDPNGWQFVKS